MTVAGFVSAVIDFTFTLFNMEPLSWVVAILALCICFAWLYRLAVPSGGKL